MSVENEFLDEIIEYVISKFWIFVIDLLMEYKSLFSHKIALQRPFNVYEFVSDSLKQSSKNVTNFNGTIFQDELFIKSL